MSLNMITPQAVRVRAWYTTEAKNISRDGIFEGLECQTKELGFGPKGNGCALEEKGQKEGTFIYLVQILNAHQKYCCGLSSSSI